jgi:hypothetical protein
LARSRVLPTMWITRQNHEAGWRIDGAGYCGACQDKFTVRVGTVMEHLHRGRPDWTVTLGYAAGYSPVRLDDEDYVGGITDEIMAQIRRSRFVVADYTGQRHNVYFEAGFALGLGLTVIPTCQADENDKLQFDIRHLNTLVWKSPDELAEGLNALCASC